MYHGSISFERLKVFHASLHCPLRNRSCFHGAVELLQLQLSHLHSKKQIVKGETSFLFIKSTLLRYKFHKIKCTYFKFSGQWILTYVYICVNTTTIKIFNISIIPKSFLMPQSINYFTLISRQILMWFYEYKRGQLILGLYTNGIIWIILDLISFYYNGFEINQFFLVYW